MNVKQLTDSGLFSINRRTHSFRRIKQIRRIDSARWHVVAAHGCFSVAGGKKLGGSKRDWFLVGDHINGTINCTSFVDALNVIESI